MRSWASRFDAVDFLRRVVHVRIQLARDVHGRVPVKMPRSVRDVPLPANVAFALAEHMGRFPPVDGYVFTGVKGNPWWHMEYGSRAFRAAADASGLPREITTHDLRHHYANVLLAAGESVVAVAERVGVRERDPRAHYLRPPAAGLGGADPTCDRVGLVCPRCAPGVRR